MKHPSKYARSFRFSANLFRFMQASTPLMAQAPRSPTKQSHMSWNASASVIKELLSLSRSINLEGEITPVEAWHILRAHPNYDRLGAQRIETFKRQLSAQVRCEGSVIPIYHTIAPVYLPLLR